MSCYKLKGATTCYNPCLHCQPHAAERRCAGAYSMSLNKINSLSQVATSDCISESKHPASFTTVRHAEEQKRNRTVQDAKRRPASLNIRRVPPVKASITSNSSLEDCHVR